MQRAQDFWEKTYHEKAPQLLGVCYRYMGNQALAEDVMHDAFLTAIQKAESFSGRGSFDAWLRRIFVNTALMRLRKLKTMQFVGEHLLPDNALPEPDEPSGSQIRHVIEQADFTDAELLAAVNQLPEHHRQVFNLYVLDNYTHAQIGQMLAISPGTSKSHLARARKRVQQILFMQANQRPQNEPQHKKKTLLWFWLLPMNMGFIEKLYKKRFHDFKLTPQNTPSNLFSSVNWAETSLPRTTIFNKFSTQQAWFAATMAGIGIMVVIAYFIYSRSFEKPSATGKAAIVPFQTADSLHSKSLLDTLKASEAPTQQLLHPKKNTDTTPVVITREVLVHKIVYIRDTVKQIDTVHVK